MNENLRKAMILYATQSHRELDTFLDGLSKPTLKALFTDLLTVYFNDKNSSKLRELTTLYVAGYEPENTKLGYNGYKLDVATGSKVYCEVKPQNVSSVLQGKIRKLNGGGSFNDYTPERFKKDIENNPIVLCSGFIDGQLIYVFEFEFRCLENRLRHLIEKKFGNRGREKGEYIRSASFSINDYFNCDSFEVIYIRPDYANFSKFIHRSLLSVLKSYAKP